MRCTPPGIALGPGRKARAAPYSLEGIVAYPNTAAGRATKNAAARVRSKLPGPAAYHRLKQHNRNTRRRAWSDAYKVSRGCVDCGYNKHPAALDFDHLPDRGRKLFPIGCGIANRSMDAIMAEIEKCEVVCSNCHRIRTATRRKQHATNV